MLLCRQMITGFNTDVRHEGRVYHVQTEDRGQDSPVLESLVYIGGTVVASKRTHYADKLSNGATEEMIASLLKRQHQVIIAAIKAGRIDDLIRHSAKEEGAREIKTKQVKPKGASGNLPAKPKGASGNLNAKLKSASGELNAKLKETNDNPPARPKEIVDSLPARPKETIDGLPAKPREISNNFPAKPKIPSGNLPARPKGASGKLPAAPVAPPLQVETLNERAITRNRTAPLGSPKFQPSPFQTRTPSASNASPNPPAAPNQNSNLAGLDLDQVISDYLKRSSEQGKLDLKVITPSAFIAGKNIGLRIQVAYGSDPEPEAVVTIKVIGTAFKPQVYIGRASRDGIASFSLSLPAFTAGTAAIVIEAQSNRGRGELKHLIRRS